jgi:hypothetical protein
MNINLKLNQANDCLNNLLRNKPFLNGLSFEFVPNVVRYYVFSKSFHCFEIFLKIANDSIGNRIIDLCI